MEIWRFEKQITLSEKKPPLAGQVQPNNHQFLVIVANYLDPFSSVIEQAINVLLISWSPWVASGPGITFSLARA